MTVTFFGHNDTPKEIEAPLKAVLIDLIENHKATEFYVGNNGNFDTMVHRQLGKLSYIYHINYSIVLAYLPVNNIYGNNTVYPEGIETVPKRFAISYRNKWMIEQLDTVVTYVIRSFGGARQFKDIAKKKGKKVIELSEQTN